jgi:uncharacterized lipoprotein
MTQQSFATLWLSAAALLLAGCSSVSCGDAHPYQGARALRPLKAPADVTVPAPDPAYLVSGDDSVGTQRTDLDAAGSCTNAPPELVPAAGTAKAAVQAAPVAATGAPPATAAPANASKPAPVAAPPPME